MRFVEIDNDFGAVLTCAVRYAIGRRSYMPKLVVDYIAPLVPQLDNRTLWALKRDINNSAKHGALGDPQIDAPLWMNLLQEVNKELSKRGKLD